MQTINNLIFWSGQIINNVKYTCFRIPSIVRTNKILIACVEGRRDDYNDSNHIDIIMRRSIDNGLTWSEPKIIWDNENVAGNPCFVVDTQSNNNNRIHLLTTYNDKRFTEEDIMTEKILDGIGKKGERIPYHCYSDDDGLTWSTPKIIISDTDKEIYYWYATGLGNGIQIKYNEKYRGRLIIPCNHSIKIEGDKALSHHSHITYSDNGGDSWVTQLDQAAPLRTNESCIVELDDGTIMQNMRIEGRYYRGKIKP